MHIYIYIYIWTEIDELPRVETFSLTEPPQSRPLIQIPTSPTNFRPKQATRIQRWTPQPTLPKTATTARMTLHASVCRRKSWQLLRPNREQPPTYNPKPCAHRTTIIAKSEKEKNTKGGIQKPLSKYEKMFFLKQNAENSNRFPTRDFTAPGASDPRLTRRLC